MIIQSEEGKVAVSLVIKESRETTLNQGWRMTCTGSRPPGGEGRECSLSFIFYFLFSNKQVFEHLF